MKFILSLLILIFFAGCSKVAFIQSEIAPKLTLIPSSIDKLDGYESVDFDSMFLLFENNCRTQKAKNIYGELCSNLNQITDKREFFKNNFRPYKILKKDGKDEGLLTGYYEPLLYGSREKSERFKYPILAQPDDLLIIELGKLYPDLKNRRLRGRVVGNRVIPYYDRSKIDGAEAEVICYVDSEVDLFFLEVQGSGRVEFDDGETIYVGYVNQNGHPYRSIGKYLIELGEIEKENISLQSIRTWLEENPSKVDKVLYHNPSVVFFSENNSPATGALGVELSGKYSIAVDPTYVPLGSLLFINSTDPVSHEEIKKLVLAQDTGGAIKGELRADYFWGYGKEAEQKAGLMKQAFKAWILLPK